MRTRSPARVKRSSGKLRVCRRAAAGAASRVSAPIVREGRVPADWCPVTRSGDPLPVWLRRRTVRGLELRGERGSQALIAHELAHLVFGKSDSELLLHGDDHGKMLKRVPKLDVLDRCRVVDRRRVQLKNLGQDLLQAQLLRVAHHPAAAPAWASAPRPSTRQRSRNVSISASPASAPRTTIATPTNPASPKRSLTRIERISTPGLRAS